MSFSCGSPNYDQTCTAMALFDVSCASACFQVYYKQAGMLSQCTHDDDGFSRVGIRTTLSVANVPVNYSIKGNHDCHVTSSLSNPGNLWHVTIKTACSRQTGLVVSLVDTHQLLNKQSKHTSRLFTNWANNSQPPSMWFRGLCCDYDYDSLATKSLTEGGYTRKNGRRDRANRLCAHRNTSSSDCCRCRETREHVARLRLPFCSAYKTSDTVMVSSWVITGR